MQLLLLKQAEDKAMLLHCCHVLAAAPAAEAGAMQPVLQCVEAGGAPVLLSRPGLQACRRASPHCGGPAGSC